MSWVIRGARVVDPARGVDQVQDVGIADGQIVPASAVAGASIVDGAGMVVAPAFIDLHASLPDPARESRASVAGGFGTVLMSPRTGVVVDQPAAVRDLRQRAVHAACRVDVCGALTVGLGGVEIADVGLLAAAGAVAFGNAELPVRGARTLRHLLEYAGRFHRPILLRAADADLEAGGVVREGARASWLGLPHVPPEAEEIGVYTVAALVRRTGTPVHLTHVWSARGLDAVRDARDEGLPITASTTAMHLAVSDDILDTLAYAGCCRVVPPLGDDRDRAALRDGLRDGSLVGVASDHRPVPLHRQDRELELAEPGTSTAEHTLSLVLEALGGDVVAAVRALATGPAQVWRSIPSLAYGEPADVVLFDPSQAWEASIRAGSEQNSPLLGRTLRGRVGRTWVAGELRFHDASVGA
jgi:dihydroorotase